MQNWEKPGMTPEQRVEAMHFDRTSSEPVPEERIIEAIMAAVADAVRPWRSQAEKHYEEIIAAKHAACLEEREACARQLEMKPTQARLEAAAEIRARGEWAG